MPRFAEQDQGHFMQQDANECWGELMRVLKEQLPAYKGVRRVVRPDGVDSVALFWGGAAFLLHPDGVWGISSGPGVGRRPSVCGPVLRP